MREPSRRRPQRPAMPSGSPARPPDSGAALRGRRRGPRLDAHFARTIRLLETGTEDDRVVARSRALLRRHVDVVVDEVYRRLLAHPETAIQFSEGHGPQADANGTGVRANVDMRREAFRVWLLVVIDDPLDATTYEYVASVGHAHVRPREPTGPYINAEFLLITMSWVQGLFLAILAQGCTDTAELAEQGAAWCRRLMLQLDLMLAVYSSTKGSAHWY